MEHNTTSRLMELVENACLLHAGSLLEGNTPPAPEAIDTAERLVNLALRIDQLSLYWVQQARRCAHGGTRHE